jgi:hypothetical protein
MKSRIAALGTAVTLLGAVGLSQAEIVQQGGVRISFQGEIVPRTLPRDGVAPVAVGVRGQIQSRHDSRPPSLRRLDIAINRHGRLDYKGLPVCPLARIQPATTQNALAACRSSLVGRGSFSANVAIPQQSPFPSKGKLLAFNGREGGRPVIFAHIYGTQPVPTSLTLPLRIATIRKGAFGTLLSTSLPRVTSNIAFVTGITLRLERRFRFRGRSHSYLAAGCPAPRGFSSVLFPLLRASFAFRGGRTLRTVLTRGCTATDS